MSKKIGIKIPSKNELLKKYGGTLNLDASQITDHGLWLPSTFYALNYLTGGGIPFGKITEIMGESSSGKSLIAYNFAYSCQQLGGMVIWNDAEQAWNNEWAIKNGVDPKKVILLNDTQIESISDSLADLSLYVRDKLTKNQPILFVCDSISALDTVDNINSKMVDGKSEMGARAKALYKMLRIRNEMLYKLGVTQIYINQLRTKLNVGWGQDTNTTTGGAAMGYFSSIRLAFFGGRTLTVKSKGKERKAGRYVTVRVIKNKVAPPRATISKAPMYFSDKYSSIGFDRYFGLPDSLIEEDVITREKSGTFLYKGEKICRGEEAFQKLLEENAELRKELIQAANINTIGQTKQKLKKLNENLFTIEEDIRNYEKQSEEDIEEEEDS